MFGPNYSSSQATSHYMTQKQTTNLSRLASDITFQIEKSNYIPFFVKNSAKSLIEDYDALYNLDQEIKFKYLQDCCPNILEAKEGLDSLIPSKFIAIDHMMPGSQNYCHSRKIASLFKETLHNMEIVGECVSRVISMISSNNPRQMYRETCQDHIKQIEDSVRVIYTNLYIISSRALLDNRYELAVETKNLADAFYQNSNLLYLKTFSSFKINV